MRTTSKHTKTTGGPVPQKIRIEFHAEHAQQVRLAGTFNDWRPDATPMLALGDGRWGKELMLPPGRYEYLFLVDGEWESDPTAPEQVPNPYGTHNSVLDVPGPAPATKGAEP
jgi:1,4-alpha-glucan branching enzyme